jgi:hypothetical protein
MMNEEIEEGELPSPLNESYDLDNNNKLNRNDFKSKKRINTNHISPKIENSDDSDVIFESKKSTCNINNNDDDDDDDDNDDEGENSSPLINPYDDEDVNI